MSPIDNQPPRQIYDSNQATGGKYLTQFQRQQLEKSLQDISLHFLEHQKIKIILLADEGKSQTEICQLLKCAHATASRYILLAQSGNAEQWQDYHRGRPKKVNEQYLQRLKELVICSPKEFGYPFQRWTGEWLARHLEQEFGIKVTKHHINRLLKKIRPIQIKDLSSDNKNLSNYDQP